MLLRNDFRFDSPQILFSHGRIAFFQALLRAGSEAERADWAGELCDTNPKARPPADIDQLESAEMEAAMALERGGDSTGTGKTKIAGVTMDDASLGLTDDEDADAAYEDEAL